MIDPSFMTAAETRFEQSAPSLKLAIDRSLHTLSPLADDRDPLTGAMRYALLAPGKRIRPLLTMLTLQELGLNPMKALPVACALEMVHAASLVMDDLPAMDDAEERRGRPSTHKAFGEDVAMLASVALLARAQLTVLGATKLRADLRCELASILARATGETGLTLGQLSDLRAPAGADASAIAQANHLKTGVLFVAAVDFGTAIGSASAEEAQRYRAFAEQFGQAYQMLDDFDDGTALPANDRVPEDAGHITLLSRLGRDGAADRLRSHIDGAIGQLAPGGPLHALVGRLFRLTGTKAHGRLSAAFA